MTTTDAAQS